MEITITTDRNPEGWGADCDTRTAEVAAEKLAELLGEATGEAWPSAEIETGTEFIVSGGSTHLVSVEGADETTWNEIATWVGAVAEDRWEYVLGQVLYDAEEPSNWHRAEARVKEMFSDDKEAIEFCLADWPEGDVHWHWLAMADEQEIRDWVAAGIR